jgi:hypothetical protein
MKFVAKFDLKKILKTSLLLVLVFSFFIPSLASAQETSVLGFTGTVIYKVITNILSFLLFLVVKIISIFLGLTGLGLDYIVNLTIVDLKKNLTGITGIKIGWTVIRNLVNMSFIFILIYEGIMTIFGKDGAKKAVVGIISAALLINFSLFFTKVIIDASNIVTVTFYDTIVQSGTSASAPSGGTPSGPSTFIYQGLSGAYMKPLGLQTFFSPNNIKNVGEGVSEDTMIIYAGTSILLIIVIFVFIAIAVLLIMRYLVFILLMIMSPLGFLFGLFPKAKTYGDMYWGTLFGQAIFAPLYMLMTWIVLTIMSSPGFISNPGAKPEIGSVFTSPDQNNISLLINFALVIGLTIASLIVAKRVATQGGMLSAKMVSQGTAFAGGAIFGGAAWAGRTTFGRVGGAVAESEKLKDLSKKGGASGWLAKQAIVGGQKTASSTFDARNTQIAGVVTKKLETDFGSGLPWRKDAGKGGYKGRLEEKVKTKAEQEQNFAETLKYSPEQIATAREKLKNVQFIQDEERRKNDWWNNIRKNEQSFKDREISITNAYNNADPQRQVYVQAQAEVQNKDAEIKKIRGNLAKAQRANDTALINTLTASLATEMTTLQAKKDAETQAKELYDEALSEYNRLNAEKKAELQARISEEKENLLRIIGGQEEEKDKYGNVIKKEIKTRGGEYLGVKADSIGYDEAKGKGRKRTWLLETGYIGNTKIFTKNKEISRKLRELSKKTKK